MSGGLGSTRAPDQPAGSLSVRRRPRDPGVPIDYAVLSDAAPPDPKQAGYDAGFDAGYADGWAAAAAAAEEAAGESRARVGHAVQAFERAATAATQSHADRQVQLERSLSGFAFDVVETLFGRELQLSTHPGREAVARALALDDTGLPATARLHPDDVDALGDTTVLGGTRAITVVADPGVERGGAVVDIGETTIDSQLSQALGRLRGVLAGDRAGEGEATA